MKVIRTKFKQFTETKPARIIAKTEGLPSVTFCNDRDSPENHREAAERLLRCYNWDSKIIGGKLDECNYVFVFADSKI